MDAPTPDHFASMRPSTNVELVRRMRRKADGHPYGRSEDLFRIAADALEATDAKLAEADDLIRRWGDSGYAEGPDQAENVRLAAATARYLKL